MESGLQQAASKVEEFSNNVQRSVEKIAGFAGLALSVDAFGESIKRAIDSGDRLQLLSQRMGTSVENLSRLQYAAALTDIPVEALTSSLDHFHETLGRAELGTGRAGKAIAAMGIDAKKLLDLPFEAQLEAIADKLSKIENPARRAAFEMILFGQEGAKLDPLLRQGAAGIQRLMEEADRAGVTIDGQMTEKLKAAHEEMVKADAIWSHASTTLAAALSPAILVAANLFEKFASGISVSAQALQRYFGGPQTEVASLQEKLKTLQDAYQRTGEELTHFQERSGRGILGDPGSQDKNIVKKEAELEMLRREITSVNSALLQLQRTEEQGATVKPKASPDISKLDLSALTGVQVDAFKIYTDKMDDLYKSFNRSTETSIERTTDDFKKFQATIAELEAGINIIDQKTGEVLERISIDPQEGTKRTLEELDNLLPPIEVHARRVKEEFGHTFDELEQLGQKTAQSIQGAFANFLFDPFHGGARRMAIDFLEALRKMAADAAAAQIFKALFKAGDGGDHGKDTGLGGLFGAGLDKFFEGSPTGGSGGGQSTIGKALGAASGGLSKVFSSWISGLFGAAAPTAAGQSALAIPGLADGGLVSAGSQYLVGEEGPELFTASSHGIISPNSALGDLGGDTHIHMGDTNIDARGADADRIMTMLPPILAAHAARTKSDLLNAFRRTGLAAPVRA